MILTCVGPQLWTMDALANYPIQLADAVYLVVGWKVCRYVDLTIQQIGIVNVTDITPGLLMTAMAQLGVPNESGTVQLDPWGVNVPTPRLVCQLGGDDIFAVVSPSTTTDARASVDVAPTWPEREDAIPQTTNSLYAALSILAIIVSSITSMLLAEQARASWKIPTAPV